MKLTSWTFLAAALACASNAFILPTNQPDGFYTVSIDKNGTAVGDPILLHLEDDSKKTSRKGRPSTNLTTRGFPSSSVGCNYDLNQGDFQQAVSRFQCYGNWISPLSIQYYTYGSSSVYMCNYGNWNPCRGDEFVQAMGLVIIGCGNNRAGWVTIPDWAKAYGRANSGSRICF